MRIAILGGTGKEGQGLGLRWALAGHEVFIGSRQAEKGEQIAAQLMDRLAASDDPRGIRGQIRGMTNHDAARRGDLVVSTLPHAGHVGVLTSSRAELSGKLLITATIAWPPGSTERPSAGEEARDALGDETRIVAAFQTVSARTLNDMPEGHEEDVLICSDDADAAETTRKLVEDTGLRGVIAGPLERARIVEAITGLLLKLNRRYGVKSAGIRITGIDEGSDDHGR